MTDTDKTYTQKKRRAPRKISQRYLENAGLYYLERYSSSVSNFRFVMRRKIMRSVKHHGGEIEEFYPLLETVIERYIASDLLNDDLYSFAKVRRLREKGTSTRMIHAKLSQKGLSAETIEKALTEYNTREGYVETREVERDAATKYAKKKKFGKYRIPTDPERYEKDLAAMARAGFSYEIIKGVLNIEEEF